MVSEADIRDITDSGSSLELVEKQLDNFKKGFPFISLIRPATPGDGIVSVTGNERNLYLTYFDQNFRKNRIVKFVPASGAASRMFKKLFSFLESEGNEEVSLEKIEQDKSFDSIWNFLVSIRKFAFYNDLDDSLKKRGTSVQKLTDEGKYKVVVRELLSGDPAYASLPKALLKFHSYPEGSRIAAEEHLVEAAHYAADACGVARIHFTLSPEHIEKFNQVISEVVPVHSEKLGVKYDITYSVQDPATDTIAVDENNEPVRNADGRLMFRPAGHGALLRNLLIPEADILFIKNIDNVVPDRLKQETYTYKRLLGGYLLFIRDYIHAYLSKASVGQITEEDNSSCISFIREKLNLDLPEHLEKLNKDALTAELVYQLDRPIRVCGMVKNEGEPGGGPFWVRESSGRISLQIVESAQINQKDPVQKHIAGSASHFNPVDLVCCVRNFRGEKFDLNNFVDPSTGLISSKSAGGREIRAQELPGLWNGSMAGWLTIFIEVPVITFNPVKTVNDLLRDEHQS